MRTYLKAFLFLALTASIACAGANFAQAAEAAPAASAGNGMMPPVGTFDNNAAYQALTPEKQAKYNEIIKSAEEAMLPLRERGSHCQGRPRGRFAAHADDQGSRYDGRSPR